jgi:hypothetical protein
MPWWARPGPRSAAAIVELAEVLALVAQLAEAGGDLHYVYTTPPGRRVEVKIGACPKDA